ncbi:UNVERIFIED_ORG: hypothetical protein EOZ59_1896 [Serratia quinivorans]
MTDWDKEIARHKETKGFFSTLLLMVALTFLPLLFPNREKLEAEGWLVPILLVIEFVVIVPLYLKFYKNRPSFGAGNFKPATFFGFLLIILALQFVAPALLGISKTESWVIEQVSLQGNVFFLVQLTLIILAPIYEEIVFRGCLYGAFQTWFAGGKIGAAIVTSFLFALLHTQYADARMLLILFCISLTLIAARVRSNGLLMPISLHIAMNGIVLGVSYWAIQA